MEANEDPFVPVSVSHRRNWFLANQDDVLKPQCNSTHVSPVQKATIVNIKTPPLGEWCLNTPRIESQIDHCCCFWGANISSVGLRSNCDNFSNWQVSWHPSHTQGNETFHLPTLPRRSRWLIYLGHGSRMFSSEWNLTKMLIWTQKLERKLLLLSQAIGSAVMSVWVSAFFQ